jgi:methenyltetrahydromethanopterin cyclohydrolase
MLVCDSQTLIVVRSVQIDIDLPVIAVVGSQSAGKVLSTFSACFGI